MFVHRLKLRPPQLLPTWIERPVERRLGANPGVFSVVAGAGYGKTVLAARIYSRWDGPKAWYSLDDEDADRAVFIAHLEAMLSSLPSAVPLRADPASLTSPKELGSLFAEAVADAESVPLLVFDDVHVLAQSPSLAVLGEFVERASRAGAAFVLGGRSMPLSLHAVAARSCLVVAGAPDLAFGLAESRAYLEATAHARDRRTVDALARRAEGWPAGLALVATTGSTHLGDAAGPPAGAHDDETRRLLFDYLAAEVLDGLSDQERRFLLETSILDILEPETCASVVGDCDARTILGSLARRGVLVTRRSDDAFAVHQLFREFLRDTLARTQPPHVVSELYRRAAAAHAARGDDVASIASTLDSGDLDLAASMLERTAIALLGTGLLSRVDGFLTRLGRDRVERSAALLTVQGRLDHWRGDADRALLILERAIALAREREDNDVLGQALRVAWSIHATRGETPELMPVIAETLMLPGLSDATRTSLYMTLGAIQLHSGEYDEALATFERIMPAIVAQADVAMQGKVLHNSAVAHVLRGEPYAGLAMYQRALKIKAGAGQRVSAMVTLGSLIYLLRTLGDTEEAERLTREMRDGAVDVGNSWLLAYAFENEGGLQLLRGENAAAMQTLREAERICDPADVVVLPDVRHGLAQAALALGRIDEADELCVKALAPLQGTMLAHLSGPVLLVRAECAAAKGETERAAALAGQAFEVAKTVPDAVLTAAVDLDGAALLLRLGRALPPAGAADAERRAAVAAGEAIALIHQRNYRFLLRTKAATFAELAPYFRRWDIGRGLLPDDRQAATASLRIEMFGGLRVLARGEALPADVWKRRRARDIFAYLVSLRGKAAARDRLIDLYWPDADADAAHDNLRVTISAVRKAVGDVIKFEANGYRFVAPPNTTIDVVLFDDAIDAARHAVACGIAADARSHYMAAIDLFRGAFLEGFDDGGWQWRERERTQAACLEALRWLVASEETDLSYRRLALDRLLEFAPFDIDAVRMRLESMLADMRVDAARRDYAEWRERYVAAVGGEPPDLWTPSLVAHVPLRRPA